MQKAKIKGKVFPVLFFNWVSRNGGVLGNGDRNPYILNLSTRWRWVVSFTP